MSILKAFTSNPDSIGVAYQYSSLQLKPGSTGYMHQANDSIGVTCLYSNSELTTPTP